ncbi:MAG: acyl-CoA dehydrogenase domain-containing protein [Gammaproteobacteria bacterium]|nr:acyl-CoA dehydrogenase domain-containing protein [Gammaproteobacteria bacterium]
MFAGSPVSGPTARHYRRLAWASARFALLADLAMYLIGSKLKARGNLSGRFADALTWQVLAVAALRRYEAEGRRQEDLPLVQFAVRVRPGARSRRPSRASTLTSMRPSWAGGCASRRRSSCGRIRCPRGASRQAGSTGGRHHSGTGRAV